MGVLSIVVPPKSGHQIDQEALGFIRRHYPYLLENPQPFPIIDFFDVVLFERYGLATGVEDLPKGYEGATKPSGDVVVSKETFENAERGDGRARFTMAHEAYHGIEHLQYISRLDLSDRLTLHRRNTHKIAAYCDPEWQANTFASSLLMPGMAVRTLSTRTSAMWLTEAIADTFEVSYTAAKVRRNKLHL